MSQLKANLDTLSTSAASQVSQGLIVQNYCTSILQQPHVDFSELKDLKSGAKLIEIGTRINATLDHAKQAAKNYIENTQPRIITNLTAIDNYANLHTAIPRTIPEGSDSQKWLQVLKAIEGKAREHQTAATGVADELRLLHTKLSDIAGTFNGLVSDLNVLVEGNNGALAEIQKSLEDINAQIAGAITAIALGGLAIAGGIFVVAIGAIAGFVTAGTSTPVVMGGVVMILAGAGAVAGGSIALVGLLDQQRKTIASEQDLKQQVKLAQLTQSNLVKIADQTKQAAESALQMSNAWHSLGGTLGNLASDLEGGRTNTDIMRTLFLETANSDIVDVKNGVATIKRQLAGVSIEVAPPGGNVIELSNVILRRHAA